MNFFEFIKETTEGWLGLRGNELLLRDKVGDPTKVRGQSPNGGIIAIGADRILDGGDPREIGYVLIKADERYGPRSMTSEFEFWHTPPAGQHEGQDSICSFVVRHDGVFRVETDPAGHRSYTPFVPGNLPGVGGHPSAMWSPDGYTVTQQNNGYIDEWGVRHAGNFTNYLLARPFDVGRYMAIWSSDTGAVQNPRWEGV